MSQFRENVTELCVSEVQKGQASWQIWLWPNWMWIIPCLLRQVKHMILLTLLSPWTCSGNRWCPCVTLPLQMSCCLCHSANYWWGSQQIGCLSLIRFDVYLSPKWRQTMLWSQKARQRLLYRSTTVIVDLHNKYSLDLWPHSIVWSLFWNKRTSKSHETIVVLWLGIRKPNRGNVGRYHHLIRFVEVSSFACKVARHDCRSGGHLILLLSRIYLDDIKYAVTISLYANLYVFIQVSISSGIIQDVFFPWGHFDKQRVGPVRYANIWIGTYEPSGGWMALRHSACLLRWRFLVQSPFGERVKLPARLQVSRLDCF